MQELLSPYLEQLSFLVGVLGVAIILLGITSSFISFLFTERHSKYFKKTRSRLNSFLILGLDFLVAKDIMDTILLNSDGNSWFDLAKLVVIVSLRIALAHSLERELEHLTEKK